MKRCWIGGLRTNYNRRETIEDGDVAIWPYLSTGFERSRGNRFK